MQKGNELTVVDWCFLASLTLLESHPPFFSFSPPSESDFFGLANILFSNVVAEPGRVMSAADFDRSAPLNDGSCASCFTESSCDFLFKEAGGFVIFLFMVFCV